MDSKSSWPLIARRQEAGNKSVNCYMLAPRVAQMLVQNITYKPILSALVSQCMLF